ncbi:hypothetical protein Nepgr_026635 [Nepenthes gracilis]|uniref:Uncharacterized protein n=1 Tax=Nepenthes gracilis TaxID=150966 RepID=A0AAD3Y0K0_NEPGR|nr:hypothetical protein Nepgr_026635 [Nepenthes gracilis]
MLAGAYCPNPLDAAGMLSIGRSFLRSLFSVRPEWITAGFILVGKPVGNGSNAGMCNPGAVLSLKAIAAVYRADLFWRVDGAGAVPVGGLLKFLAAVVLFCCCGRRPQGVAEKAPGWPEDPFGNNAEAGGDTNYSVASFSS